MYNSTFQKKPGEFRVGPTHSLKLQVTLTDPFLRSYTFTALPAAWDITIRYAIRASSGTGPWSPVTLQRVKLGAKRW